MGERELDNRLMQEGGDLDRDNPWYDLDGEYSLDEETWVTKEGEEIPYPELSHGHLASIIKMIHRELLAIHTGGWPQGEMAQDVLESAVSQREDELTALEAEKQRRLERAFP